MCQLLGMNCAAPTDFSFSLKGFCRRGGETDIHSHGWGLCLYEGRGVRSFHDTLPASKSPIADLVQNYPMRTYNMVAHIRYATQGEVSLENVHPFNRVWKGVQMTFCHNGDCPQFSTTAQCAAPLLGRTTLRDVIYHPVGDTDSEAVFCAILNALTVEFPDGLPTLPVLHEFLSILCAEIIEGHPESTIFNFLLGCGQYTLFAYSWPGQRHGSSVWNGLYYIVRQPPFSTAKLLDTDYEIDFRRVTTPADRVAVITTKPLTEEPGWTEFKRGELIMFDKGLPYRTPKCCEFVEEQGRGLFSKAVKAKCSRSPGRETEREKEVMSMHRNRLVHSPSTSPSSVALSAMASNARGMEPPSQLPPCMGAAVSTPDTYARKGVPMTFCHNGDCPQFSASSDRVTPLLLGRTTADDIIFHPVGETDSEAVFCAILNALTVEFHDGLPTLPLLHEFLSELCSEIVQCHPDRTILNFLLGCGQFTQFAYSWPGQREGSSIWNGLYYVVRQHPFVEANTPEANHEIQFADRVAIIATKPLTEEPGWIEFKRGELFMFDLGLPYQTPSSCEAVEEQGRGLLSKAVKTRCCRSTSQQTDRKKDLALQNNRLIPSSSSVTLSTLNVPALN